MTIKEISNRLAERLTEYTFSEVYKLNNSAKEITEAILKAIKIVSEAESNSTKINENEKKWFQGIGIVSKLFDDREWGDISELYYEFSKKVQEKYF